MPKTSREEREMLRSFERGEWKAIKRLKTEVYRYQGYARATFQKNRRINIRISSKDLEGMQKKALAEGIPYQTLISSVIHKYIAGTLTGRQP